MSAPAEDQEPEAICMGCNNVIEEGSVVAFGESLFHLECFVCAKCSSPVDCESNLLLLTDGRPVCENCSYNCHICKQAIRDEAIMTGEEAYHADCFKCVLCKKKIDDLVFTQTTKGIFCTTCHEQRKLDKQKRKEERQRLQNSQKPPSPSGYVDKTLPSLPPEYANMRGNSRRDVMNHAGNRHASRMFDVQVVNDYMASLASAGGGGGGGGGGKGQGRNPLDPRPRNESLDIPRRRMNDSFEQRRPSPPLRTNSEPSDDGSIPLSPEPMVSKTDPFPISSPHSDQPGSVQSEDTSILSSILLNDSTTSLLDSSPESTPTSSIIGTSVKSDGKSPSDKLLLEIPPMNFSFFETESDELANLTKLLGTSIQLNANDGTTNPDNDNFHLNNDKPPTPPPASSDRISTDFTNFPQPPVSVPRKNSNASLLSGVSSDGGDVQSLRAQLKSSNAKLAETEGNLNKIKTVSRRALDEFTRAKEEFAKEVAARQQTEVANRQLRAQLAAFQQASILGSDSFLKAAREEIMRLSNLRGELEKTCNDLKSYRESVSADLDDMVKKKQAGLLSSANPILHLERKQQALFAAIKSMTAERDVVLQETRRLEKTRDEVINEMVMLNTKNAELTSLNNDLSRRVTEREREAAAVMAGTSFLGSQPAPSKSAEGLGSASSLPQRKSSDSHSHAGAVRRIVQRDSFNGTQAPKMFRLKRAKEDAGKMFGKFAGGGKGGKPEQSTGIYNGLNGASTSSVNLTSQHHARKDSRSPQRSQESTIPSLAQGSHTFIQTSFLRPVKCDVCCEKMWGLNELRCQACGFLTHMKCVSHVPQYCLGLHTNSENHGGGDNDSAYSKGGTLFGNDLTKQVEVEGRTIPLVVERCIAAVELRGMDYEGIYRKSGGAAQMRSIQLSFEQGLDPDLTDDDEYNDICAVTSILKQYFRELPIPLITFELYPQFLEAIGMAPGEEKSNQFINLLSQLPTANYDTLKALFTHLNNVKEQADENLMTAKNLAVVFGPTLMRDQDPSRDLLDMNAKNATVEYIITNTTTLFATKEDSS